MSKPILENITMLTEATPIPHLQQTVGNIIDTLTAEEEMLAIKQIEMYSKEIEKIEE